MRLRTRAILLTLLLATIIIFNYLPEGGMTGKASWTPEENGPPPEIYFCAKENCTQAMLELFSNAQQSIHCAFYELNIKEIKDVFIKRSNELEVKLVIDDESSENAEDIPNTAHDRKGGLMHNKFCIIDGTTMFTGSTNPTSTIYENDNNLLIFKSRNLANSYEEEFSEMYGGIFGKGKLTEHPRVIFNNMTIQHYFCPEDWCASKVIDELDKANHSIYFMAFSFTHEDISRMLQAKKKDGLEIKGVIEKSQNGQYCQLDELQKSGIQAGWDGNSRVMHHKVFIIDNKTVITGSFNPTKNADENNDENMLVIEDEGIAKLFLAEFERVWGNSVKS